MAAPVLSEKDRKFIDEMRKRSVLTRIQPNLLTPTDGAAFLICGDGDHSLDNVNHIAQLLRRCGSKEKPHLMCTNGGAIWIPQSELLKTAPLMDNGKPIPVDQYLLWQIESSLKLKGFKHLFIGAHAPCGVAKSHGFSAFDVVEYVMAAKQRIRSHPGIDPSVEVYTLLHVFDADQGPTEQRKTWFVDPHQWAVHGPALRTFDGTPSSPRLLEAAAATT